MSMTRRGLDKVVSNLRDLGLVRVTLIERNLHKFEILPPPDDICPPEFLGTAWKPMLAQARFYERSRLRKRSDAQRNDPDSMRDEEVRLLSLIDSSDYDTRIVRHIAPSEEAESELQFHVPRTVVPSSENCSSQRVRTVVQGRRLLREETTKEDYSPNGEHGSADADRMPDPTLVAAEPRAPRAARDTKKAESRRAKIQDGQEPTKSSQERRSSRLEECVPLSGTTISQAVGTSIDEEAAVPESEEQRQRALEKRRNAQVGLGADGRPLDVSASSGAKGERSSFEKTTEVSSERFSRRSEMYAHQDETASESHAEAAKRMEAAMSEAPIQKDAAPHHPFKLYAFLARIVRDKFEGHTLLRPGRKELGICANLIKRYSPEELFEMIQLMVLDWDNIRYGNVFMRYKTKDSRPTLLFLASNAEILHSHIGRGITAGGGHRFSAYEASYKARKSGSATDATGASQPTPEVIIPPSSVPMNPVLAAYRAKAEGGKPTSQTE